MHRGNRGVNEGTEFGFQNVLYKDDHELQKTKLNYKIKKGIPVLIF